MANEKLSQLTQITTPAGTDTMYIIQGGVSLSVTLTQVKDYVESALNSELIPFDDASTGGLVSNFVGGAIRELDDNFDSYVSLPILPEYTMSGLPSAVTYPRLMAFATGTDHGDVPVYSDGAIWRYFSDDAAAGLPTVPQGDISFSTTAPIVTQNVPSADLSFTTTAPTVVVA